MKNHIQKKCLLLIGITICMSSVQAGHPPKLIVSTIAKSGTFLLEKVVHRLTKKSAIGGASTLYASLLESQWPQGFLLAHAPATPVNVAALEHCSPYKIIVLIRDPRDVAVSMYHYFGQGIAKQMGILFSESGALLTEIIKRWELAGFPVPENRLVECYESFLGWQTKADCYVTRFEHLVGARGGGSDELQKTEIKNIAQFLEVSITDQEISEIAKQLFGGSATFREGKIGSWKKNFTSEHVSVFKHVTGDLLIKLGYEKDLNWDL